ncbi:DUF2971 domain-containing protein [Marinifilum sp. JC120]|nr:DUF2971 domain-containing protein [Marinifilum sp. JC120]
MKDIENRTNWDASLWRYFKTERFIELLKTSSIYFSSATQFEDRFEGACQIVTQKNKDITIDYTLEHAFKDLRRMIKISCWHTAQYESDAMWKLYAGQRKGIAITTTPKKLKNGLKPYQIKPTYGEEKVHCGPIEYIDLSKKSLKPSLLNTFYKKHMAFEWEKEFRLAISLRLADEYGVDIPDEGISVDVNLEKLIDRIVLGPNLEKDTIEQIYKVANSVNLADKIEMSTLTYTPMYVPAGPLVIT